MAKPEVRARDVMNDIQSGISNSELRKKYRLSEKGLMSLFGKLVRADILTQTEVEARLATDGQPDGPSPKPAPAPDPPPGPTTSAAPEPKSEPSPGPPPKPAPPAKADAPPPPKADPVPTAASPAKPPAAKPKLDLKQVAEDIKLGVEDAEIMKKYSVSPDGLEKLFNKLLEAGLMSEEQFYERILQAETDLVDVADEALAPPTKPAPAAKSRQEKKERHLILAAKDGKLDKVVMHLDGGAAVNGHDDFGDTALLVAADAGHYEVVKLLLDKGADVNLPDAAGDTPLMLAAKRRKDDVVKLLINRGADVNTANKQGDTALSLAKGKKFKEIEEMLIAHNAK